MIIETPRLRLRELCPDDEAFMLSLLTDPEWIKFIGDRGVRSLEGARDYLIRGPIEMYARLGFGLWLTERKSDDSPIGICGLIKRETLDDVDLGFAFLPAYRSQGYAFEAAAACLDYAKSLDIKRIVAITIPENTASIRLLQKLGFRFEQNLQLGPKAETLQLFVHQAEYNPIS